LEYCTFLTFFFLTLFRVFEVSDSIIYDVAHQIEAEISKVCYDMVKVDMPVKILTGKRWGDLKAVPTKYRNSMRAYAEFTFFSFTDTHQRAQDSEAAAVPSAHAR
jgi:hypothetical protein